VVRGHPQQLVAGDAKEPGRVFVGVHERVLVHVDHEERVGGVLHQGPIPAFALAQGLLGARPLRDLRVEAVVRREKRRGAGLDLGLQGLVRLAELLLHALPLKELGHVDRGAPRPRAPGGGALLPGPGGDVLLDSRRRSHDETAMSVAAGEAFDLGRDQGHAEALLAPPGGVAGAHDADREVALAALAEPRVRLEGKGMIVDEEVVFVGGGVRLREDLHERPAREGEMDGAGREPLDRLFDTHPRMKRPGIGLADGVGHVEEQVARDHAGFIGPLVLVEAGHEVEELDRHRGRAQEDVPLARDREGAAGGVLGLRREVSRHVVLGLQEERTDGLRDADRGEPARRGLGDPVGLGRRPS